MLRHKYTKKRLRNKFNKKTRKRGGTNNPKRKKLSESRRKEMERLSLRDRKEDNKLSPKDERDAQMKMSVLLGEKCDAATQVNDDGSIDCPNKRSKALRKISKFHNDKKQNQGCEAYANDMMTKYNETCYGDDDYPNRKWDKHDSNWRNTNYTEFYEGGDRGEKKNNFVSKDIPEIPSTCKKPAKKMFCRYCDAKGVTDPKCRCCPGTEMAQKSVQEEMRQLENQPYVNPRDLLQPTTSVKSDIVPLQLEDARPEIDYSQTYKDCRVVKIPKGAKYWTRSDGSISFQAEEGAKETIGDQDIYYYYNNSGKSTYEKDDGTCDPVMMLEDSPKVDASNTFGNCRELKIPKGTKYWLKDGQIFFNEKENAQEIISDKDIDYFYNSNGDATFDKNDGTCDMTKDIEQKKTESIDKYMKIWMSTHFSSLKEEDKNSPNKAITWLLS